jgi:MFS family permease
MSTINTVRTPAMSRQGAVLFAATTLVTVFSTASVPTPLYRLYQESWGLAPVVLTIVFAAYAAALLAALLTVGSLSDHVGRRPLILAALLTNMAALGLFILADSAAWLVAARLLQGIATGVAATTLGAVLLDVDRARGALINSLAPIVGMAVGALGAGALVAYATAPTQLAYAVLLVVHLGEVLLLRFMPETVERLPGAGAAALASLRPRVAVPVRARRVLLMIAPVNVAIWALGGFYLSLMPSLIGATTGLTSPLVGGAVVAALTFSGAAAIFLLQPWRAGRILVVCTTALASGVAVTLAGVYLNSVPLLAGGTIVAGFGWGGGFFGGMRSVMPLAAPAERAALLAAIYVESYIAFGVPAIAVGLAVPVVGLPTASYFYGGGVIVLAAVSLVATLIGLRRAVLCPA